MSYLDISEHSQKIKSPKKGKTAKMEEARTIAEASLNTEQQAQRGSPRSHLKEIEAFSNKPRKKKGFSWREGGFDFKCFGGQFIWDSSVQNWRWMAVKMVKRWQWGLGCCKRRIERRGCKGDGTKRIERREQACLDGRSMGLGLQIEVIVDRG